MNLEKLEQFFEKVFLTKFLINFVPGFIMYHGISYLTNLTAGTGVFSAFFIICISWTLGVFLQLVFFDSKPPTEDNLSKEKVLKLLIGKLSIATLFTLVIIFFSYVSQKNISEHVISRIILASILFLLLSVVGIFIYKKK